jgi:hypothetical protein
MYNFAGEVHIDDTNKIFYQHKRSNMERQRKFIINIQTIHQLYFWPYLILPNIYTNLSRHTNNSYKKLSDRWTISPQRKYTKQKKKTLNKIQDIHLLFCFNSKTFKPKREVSQVMKYWFDEEEKFNLKGSYYQNQSNVSLNRA